MRFPHGLTDWPFPHAVFDGLWDDDLLQRAHDEFPRGGWREFENDRERKFEYSAPGTAAGQIFNDLASEETLLSLTDITGIPDLSMELVGGGYHLIPPGGYLDIHTDFNRSPLTGLYRRLNCLIYLNRDWQDPGGRLELWDSYGPGDDHHYTSVEPEWNRTVIFETSDRSWHGHPQAASRERRSLAAYFYSPEPPPGYSHDHDTVWLS